MSVEIRLDEKQMAWCSKHAKKTYEYRESIREQFGVGEYAHNTVNGALIGIKCEMAFLSHFDLLFEIDNFFNSCPTVDTGDFKINNRCIEVKGLKEDDWNKYKRQVPPIQLNKYIAKDVIIVWATAENHRIPRNKVVLRGWNYASEVKEKGKDIKTICDNVWLEYDEDMHDMDTLIRALKDGG